MQAGFTTVEVLVAAVMVTVLAACVVNCVIVVVCNTVATCTSVDMVEVAVAIEVDPMVWVCVAVARA